MSRNEEEYSSVTSIKSQLQSLGISTSTPGIMGEDRHEELRRRLLEAQGDTRFINTSFSSSSSSSSGMNMMMTVSIAEIKERLMVLGEV